MPSEYGRRTGHSVSSYSTALRQFSSSLGAHRRADDRPCNILVGGSGQSRSPRPRRPSVASPACVRRDGDGDVSMGRSCSVLRISKCLTPPAPLFRPARNRPRTGLEPAPGPARKHSQTMQRRARPVTALVSRYLSPSATFEFRECRFGWSNGDDGGGLDAAIDAGA